MRFYPYIKSSRPSQWYKNVLVLSVPLSAGLEYSQRLVTSLALTTISFILVSAGLYTYNDIVDKQTDRVNPAKASRPVTAGTISTTSALVFSAACVASGLLLSSAVARNVLYVLLAYCVLMLLYNYKLKSIPWLDVLVISLGFVLRMLAGAASANEHITIGFSVIGLSGASLMLLGKRLSETVNTDRSKTPRRKVLEFYSVENLRRAMHGSLLLATLAYFWVGLAAYDSYSIYAALYYMSNIFMFMSGLVYINYSLKGKTEAPELVLVKHPYAATLVVLWAVFFLITAYAPGA